MIDWSSLWESIKLFFAENWLANVIAFLTFGITTVGILLTHYHNKKSIPEKALDARTEVKNMSLNVETQIKTEPLFFDEPTQKSDLFCKKIMVNNKEKRIFIHRLKNTSYILTGDAGCGKSALLKYDFLTTFSKHHRKNNSAIIFLYSYDLIKIVEDKPTQKEFLKKIQNAKLKTIFLYLDGVDEIGDVRCAAFYDFINYISKLASNIIFKISCRTEFAHNYLEREKSFSRIQKIFKIGAWTPSMLYSYAKKLIKHLDKNKYQSICNLSAKAFLKEEKNWEKHVNSPLLMKIYIYIKIHGGEFLTGEIKNKYSFYDHFINVLLKTYYTRTGSPILDDEMISSKEIQSKTIFSVFSHGGKDLEDLPELDVLSPILKNTSSNKKTFVHETFFEYYVASYYYSKLINPSFDSTVISVFYQNYSNDFADFISDAIITENTDQQNIFDKLLNIYYSTLNEKTKQIFIQRFPSFNPSGFCQLSTLTEQQFFSLKYEIIFRMGRLNSLNNENLNTNIIDFLEFVYEKDDNIKYSKRIKYYLVVLKRCCAISASFLGGEKIEIDYVKHMLSFYDYNEHYDLANRSHTLLFYGDVKNKNIFNFRDDNIVTPYENAFKKRIDRLSLPLPSHIDNMDKQTKKKYFFRLFDLATIYTFMKHRGKALTVKEHKIISQCKVVFDGASSERSEIMKKIKEEILALNNDLQKNR